MPTYRPINITPINTADIPQLNSTYETPGSFLVSTQYFIDEASNIPESKYNYYTKQKYRCNKPEWF